MPHVSIDGPARPPYVNVAFQPEEIELERGGVAAAGCWVALSHVSFRFFFFLFFQGQMFLNAFDPVFTVQYNWISAISAVNLMQKTPTYTTSCLLNNSYELMFLQQTRGRKVL